MIKRFSPDSFKRENWCSSEFSKIGKIIRESGLPFGKGLTLWKKAFLGGALILTEMDGKEFPGLINADIVKKYYAWDHKKKDLSELKTWKGDFGRKRKKRV